MSAQTIFVFAVLAPFLHAMFVMSLSRPPGLRDVVHIGFSFVTALLVFLIVGAVGRGETPGFTVSEPVPGAPLAFAAEPIGVFVAATTAGLGVLAAMHTAGYARATRDPAPARLMGGVALCMGLAQAAAFSANLFTFFLCYQGLVLASFPLVAHGGGEDGRRAALGHMATLLAASIGLLLPATIWAQALTDGATFQVGGALAGRLDAGSANVLLAMFVFGLAMTAPPLLHRWLASSIGAPFPSLIVIHALGLIPAGCVGLLKVTIYVFGAGLREASVAAHALMIMAGAGMCYAALVSLTREDVRERLAYAAMAQSLAVVLGALLALPAGTFAAALQVAALACGGATMLMAAGAAYAVTERGRVEELRGLGRIMPWTMAGFAIGAASVIGMPPFSGAWAKLWLITASADAGAPWAAGLVGLSAVLLFASLAPLAANALVGPAPVDPFKRSEGASLLLVTPIVLGAAATLWLLLAANTAAWFLGPALGGRG